MYQQKIITQTYLQNCYTEASLKTGRFIDELEKVKKRFTHVTLFIYEKDPRSVTRE